MRNKLSNPGDVRDHAEEQDGVLDLRDSSGEARDDLGDARDHAGDERDHAGEERDHAADERDRVAEDFEARHRYRAADLIRRSEVARRDAAADRQGASEDRLAGAGDRTQAELDRASAHADRDSSARERHDATVDPLTGVSCRGAGFLALDRDIARATRAGQSLVAGFIDVDHLKAVNDGQGHAAGDQMLVEVADALRSHLRAYDLIFRYGGDEFVCALSGVDAAFCESRMASVNSALALAAVPASVTAGFAELRAGDSSAELVARADAALYRERQG